MGCSRIAKVTTHHNPQLDYQTPKSDIVLGVSFILSNIEQMLGINEK